MPLYRKRSQTDPYPAGSTYLFKPGPDRLSCQRIEAFWLKPEKLSRAGLPQLPGYSLYGKESGQGTADQSGLARATYYRIFHTKRLKRSLKGGWTRSWIAIRTPYKLPCLFTRTSGGRIATNNRSYSFTISIQIMQEVIKQKMNQMKLHGIQQAFRNISI